MRTGSWRDHSLESSNLATMGAHGPPPRLRRNFQPRCHSGTLKTNQLIDGRRSWNSIRLSFRKAIPTQSSLSPTAVSSSRMTRGRTGVWQPSALMCFTQSHRWHLRMSLVLVSWLQRWIVPVQSCGNPRTAASPFDGYPCRNDPARQVPTTTDCCLPLPNEFRVVIKNF